MIQRFSFAPTARVHVIADRDETMLGLSSGGARIVILMAEPVARAIATELHQAMPPGATITRRPREPRADHGRPIANWRAVLVRLRAGKPLPSDADAVATFLEYFGVSVT